MFACLLYLQQRRAVQEPDGKLRVTVKKSRPILGIAIEGGCDVNNQPQPRIISIHVSLIYFELITFYSNMSER